jgi:Flp pilus assembly pilin Flp
MISNIVAKLSKTIQRGASSFYRKIHGKGQGLVEYSLVLVLVAIGLISGMMLLGGRVGNVFSSINNSLSSVINVVTPTPIPLPTLTPTPTPIPTPIPTWTDCAVENGFCSFTGTALVRYGANGVYATGTFTNGVGCNNTVFGDPLYGVVKACQVLQ